MTQQSIQFNIFFWLLVAGLVFYFYQKKPNKQPKTITKKIKETKCTCQACGNVWYYGKSEEWENKANRLINTGSTIGEVSKGMACCGGCVPALFIPPDQKIEVKDLDKCPKCNSTAMRKEEIIHEV
jgi:hypothetical protein